MRTTALAFLALASAGALAAGPTRAPDALESARPFYKLILENDAVRVFEHNVPPGQTAPAHHLGCRVVYALSEQIVRTTTPDGVVVDARKPFRAAWWRGADDQAVTNLANKNAFSLVVEFKGQVPGGRGCSDAVSPSPAAAWATPATMAWTKDETSGASRIDVIGNPAVPGPYVTRLRLPAGHRSGTHAHSARYEGTVLSGTLHLRLVAGDQVVVLPAGSFVTVPAGLVHEEWTVDGVELEMRGEGPSLTTPVK